MPRSIQVSADQGRALVPVQAQDQGQLQARVLVQVQALARVRDPLQAPAPARLRVMARILSLMMAGRKMAVPTSLAARGAT
tara:strand:- start:656 stop:898 length:243 start_codon:yes stop_codon:yes gene_type:complete